MKFAHIQNGVVAELIDEFVTIQTPGVPTEDDPLPATITREVPLGERYHPDFVSALIALPDASAVLPGDSYDGTRFGPPPQPPAPPPLTAVQALAQREVLKAHATSMIDPLVDAVELDEATPAEMAALKAWKVYRLALARVEQQAGFPTAIDWPKAPE